MVGPRLGEQRSHGRVRQGGDLSPHFLAPEEPPECSRVERSATRGKRPCYLPRRGSGSITRKNRSRRGDTLPLPHPGQIQRSYHHGFRFATPVATVLGSSGAENGPPDAKKCGARSAPRRTLREPFLR